MTVIGIILLLIVIFIVYVEFKPVKKIRKKEDLINSFSVPELPEEIKKYFVIAHVHTQFSFDSLGKPSDIKKAVEENGIDFVFITDHNNMDYKHFEDEKIFAGIEKNTDDGRLLLLGGELPVISHPNNFEFEHYKWKGEFKKDYLYEIVIPKDAIVWSKKKTLAVLLKNIFLFPFKRNLVHKWNSLIPMEKWMDLYFSRARGENLIGGLDLHIKLVYQERTHGILIPSYIGGFKWIQNHVYSKKELKTKEDVLESLKNGNLYVTIDYSLKDETKRNSAEIFGKYGDKTFILGENVPIGTEIYCKFKRKKAVKILKHENSPEIITENNEFSYKIQKNGFYHLEMFEYDFKIGSYYFGFRPIFISNFFKAGEQ